MKLYYHPQSTYSRRVRILAHEKNLRFEEIHVAMDRLEHKKREFLRLNPFGRVPVLEDDTLILRESNAIMIYLDEKFPEKPFMPETLAKKAQCLQWLTCADLDFARHCDMVYFPKRFLPETRWPLDDMKKAVKALTRNFAILGEQLGEKPYLLGQFSLADIAFMPFLQFIDLTGIALPANLQTWADSLLARPSAHATKPPAVTRH